MYLECFLGLSLVPPVFDDTSSLGYPPRLVVYPRGLTPWVTASHFLVENRGAKLKPTTYSSFLLFRVFLSFLFS